MTESFATWKEIATSFLKIGTTAYGGPAIMGVMQAEIQERRQWTSKPRFLEGLGLVNVLPGATMVQLAIFLGYQRAGWWGGLLAGLCFTAPAFVVLSPLALAIALVRLVPWSLLAVPATATGGPSLGGVAAVFTGLGAFTFGGGLSIIALMQEQVVDRLHWLTPREFVDGLALGQ